MKVFLKKLIRSTFSYDQIYKAKSLVYRTEYNRTKTLFEQVEPHSDFLNIRYLRELHNQYDPLPEYSYSKEALDKRGNKRALDLLSIIPDEKTNAFLDVGCWDGMICYHLKQMGKKPVGIDFRDEGFDRRAVADKVKLLKMDAMKMEFEDNSFDLAFSFDSFEHFSNPEKVLSELVRVVKPGGYIYLDFGPLFFSSFGLHAFVQTPVPYCQFLFSNETILKFLKEENLGTLDFDHCNGWSLKQFQELWTTYSNKLEKISYTEAGDYKHMNLIRKHAPLFKNKTTYFDDLTTGYIRALFKVKT